MASSLPRQYVQDLKTWDLPRLEDLEHRLVDEFAAKARLVFLEGERLGGQLHALFLERLREMAGEAVNEILEYWLCIELPYLDRGEGRDPLALAYCVDNEDGSRTELIRVTLDRVFERILDERTSSANTARLETVVRQLRSLAKTLEQRVQSLRG
jgi:hypothetical protein